MLKPRKRYYAVLENHEFAAKRADSKTIIIDKLSSYLLPS